MNIDKIIEHISEEIQFHEKVRREDEYNIYICHENGYLNIEPFLTDRRIQISAICALNGILRFIKNQ